MIGGFFGGKDNLRLGIFSFLVHDVQDHPAGSWAAFGAWVDADRLLSSTCILFAVNVNPAAKKQTNNKSNKILGWQMVVLDPLLSKRPKVRPGVETQRLVITVKIKVPHYSDVSCLLNLLNYSHPAKESDNCSVLEMPLSISVTLQYYFWFSLRTVSKQTIWIIQNSQPTDRLSTCPDDKSTHLLPVCLVMLRIVAPSLPIMAPTYCVSTSNLKGRSACGGLEGIPELGDTPLGPPRGP